MNNLNQQQELFNLEENMTDWYNEYFWNKYEPLSTVPNTLTGINPQKLRDLSIPVEGGGSYAGYVKQLHKWVRYRFISTSKYPPWRIAQKFQIIIWNANRNWSHINFDRCTAEEVDGFGEGKEILIQVLDHGFQTLVAHFMILPLRRAYLTLPIQAYAGKLHRKY